MLKSLFSKKNKSEKPANNSTPKASKASANTQSKSGGSHKRQAKQKPAAKPWNLESFKVEPQEGKSRFHDLNLRDEIMHAICDEGFQYCTPIQSQTLPLAMKGLDVIGQAQTGTGKSAAFLIGTIHQLLTYPLEERFASEPRALIIAPTRELVMQIGKDAKALTRHTDLNVVTVVGGMDYEEQRTQLRDFAVDILVATPGRLIDFMRSQDVYLDGVEVLVLDEADRMLDMGFIPDVRRIERATPDKRDRQTLFFSATFTDDIKRLIDQWTFQAKEVVIEPEQVTTDRVDQKLYLLSDDQKFPQLCKLLTEEKPERIIIFANRRDLTRNLAEKLNKAGHVAVLLSGEVNQQKRVRTLERFRDGNVKIMVATDVAGRGIHVDGVTHVVNYTLPEDPEDYVHRIGRTGRAGEKGKSVSFISEDDAFMLPDLEAYLGSKLNLEQPDL